MRIHTENLYMHTYHDRSIVQIMIASFYCFPPNPMLKLSFVHKQRTPRELTYEKPRHFAIAQAAEHGEVRV